jgi:hypothetical protein
MICIIVRVARIIEDRIKWRFLLKKVNGLWLKILNRFWKLLNILNITENSEHCWKFWTDSENSEHYWKFWTSLKILNRFWTLLVCQHYLHPELCPFCQLEHYINVILMTYIFVYEIKWVWTHLNTIYLALKL